MGRLEKLPVAALMSLLSMAFLRAQVSALHIRPQACKNVMGHIGTCMFVWECIKTEGKHLGTCVDGFLFGSCCAHNESSNIVAGASTSNVFDRVPVSRSTTQLSTISFVVPHRTTPISFPYNRTSVAGSTTPTSTTKSTVHFKPTYSPILISTATSTTKRNSPYTTRGPSTPSYPSWTFSGYRPTSGATRSTTRRPIVSFRPTERPYFPPRPSWEPHKTSSIYGFTNTLWTKKPTKSPTTSSTTKLTTTTRKIFPVSIDTSTVTTIRPRPTFSTLSTNILDILALNLTTTRRTIPTSDIIHRTPATTLVFTLSSNGAMETLNPITRPPTTVRSTWKPIIVTAPRPIYPLPQLEELSPTSMPPAVTTITTISSASSDLFPCGIQNPHPQKKVVGGKNSAFGSWPWQASVRRTSFFGFSSTHRCGGALISRKWVATAGHCVDDLLLSQIKIRVGEYDFASVQEPHGYVERGVKRKVVHPRYNFFTYENDLALVQLEEAIDEVKYPHIAPICLPPSEEDLIGKNATVTGWGRLSEGGVLPSILQEVQVPIISNEKCKNMFLAAGRHEYIPDIFMCAGFEEGGRDSCQGDSGGPLQIQDEDGHWFLAGIISWGIGCAEPNMPGVCTRISKFKDFILQNIT